MKRAEYLQASKKIKRLQNEYQVSIHSDWGMDGRRWKRGTWSLQELEKIEQVITLMTNIMGGKDRFIICLGGVIVMKSDIGSHGGEALKHQVSLSTKGTFSSWTVVHEMAHAWDANNGWKLSVALERYTGGFTSPFLSTIKKWFGLWDAGPRGEENAPGRHGRWRGCNAAGYFYGDSPSGSNWNFNRREDFAESVAMYIGWKRNNDLSQWADARIKRYLRENSAKDKYFGVDNWADYKKYFFPHDGDYTTSKRWKFVDELMHERLNHF